MFGFVFNRMSRCILFTSSVPTTSTAMNVNRLCASEALLPEAKKLAAELATGPPFAHAMTKRMLNQEWNMGVEEAIDAEAEAQAICMTTKDFHRAYEAFVAKQKPAFKGD